MSIANALQGVFGSATLEITDNDRVKVNFDLQQTSGFLTVTGRKFTLRMRLSTPRKMGAN